jgi:transcriptional regulator with XRE-family HTH domain
MKWPSLPTSLSSALVPALAPVLEPALAPNLSRAQLARAFGLRLGSAMVARGWRPVSSVLMHEFNLRHDGDPITLYTARNWLRGQFLPRPQRMVTLAQCLGVAPHQLMYGQFYESRAVQENTPALVLSDREHRLVQQMRRLSPQGLWQVEQVVWRNLMEVRRG